MSSYLEWLEQEPVPAGSIYMWMYLAGLHAVPFNYLSSLLTGQGKAIREKDIANYKRGYERSYIANDANTTHTPAASLPRINEGKDLFCFKKLSSFERSDALRVFSRRWVPCSAQNKPLIRWSEILMDKQQALGYPDSTYLAETTYRASFIVFDIDGDHDRKLSPGLLRTFAPYMRYTHTLAKRQLVRDIVPALSDTELAYVPTSFHLTFRTDRLIPSKHFANAHIDLLGNATKQLRYRKDKVWNGLVPAPLTDEVWDFFMNYIRTHS